MEYLRKAKVALLLSLSYISSLVTFTEDGATRNGSSGFCSWTVLWLPVIKMSSNCVHE